MVDEVHKHHKKDPNFRGVVYSNYISSGLMPISRQLKAKGIDHHVFHGGVSRAEKKKMVEDYNAGRKKVLLVSSSGTEGLDLKGTKLMQVAEPHWNNAKIEQVIGRGVRYKSHTHLPDEERHVKVQRYYSTRPQGRISKALRLKKPQAAERWLQARSDEKSELSNQFKKVIQEASDA
jgi:ERCC4-related helicase